VSKRGLRLRFALAPHAEVTTRAGRRYAKPPPGDEIIGVVPCEEKDLLAVVTKKTTRCVCKAPRSTSWPGPGKGVTVIKVQPDDEVLAFLCTARQGREHGARDAQGPQG
jgi:DNA gyrase subunit A